MKNLIPTLICLLLVVPSQAGIIYVDADANGANDGTSWGDAYNYLQDALVDANSDPNVEEIWVAEGIYTPDSNSADPNGSGERTATFQLISDVAIYGGFSSGGDPNWNDRDPNSYEAILSGDLDGNDTPGLDPCDLPDDPNRGENSYHVVTGSGTDANAVLDGFSITAGNANGVWEDRTSIGAGMFNDSGSPTVTNCTFSGNSADGAGGMYNLGSPTVTNCTFIANTADKGGGMHNGVSSPILTNCTFSGNSALFGGGMCNGGSPTLTNCTFTGNSASSNGGGMCNVWYSSPTVTNCTFTGNSAGEEGGGMHNSDSSPTLNNCTFSGNSADSYGGGMHNSGSSPILTNCTFSGNSALFGGGMCNSYESNPTITNCIFWDDTPNEIYIYSVGSPVISYSDIQGEWEGIGNIDVAPCFVESGYWADANDPNIVVEPNDPNAIWVNGDYHLKSEGWRWDMQRKVWTWDDVTSRCIDAGNPGCPLGEELLSVPYPYDPNNEWGENLRINMGAYGGTAEASMPPYDWALLANLTNDGKVDSNDLAAFVGYWLDSGQCIPSDLSRNQFVDFIDFALLGQDWYLETSWYTP